MKKQLLTQISNGKLINVYENPEQASIDDRNRFDPHEIRIALLANITYRGYEWKLMDEDTIDALKNSHRNVKITQTYNLSSKQLSTT